MTKPLTLFEYESKEFDWTDRDCALLERMRVSLKTEVLRPTVRGGKRAIQAAQHVGVVRLRNRTVQILPKIHRQSDKDSDDVKTREATANLLRMLAYAGELQVREHELAPLMRQTDNWFEILTRLFATHLREKWQRGAHRNYQTVEDDLPLLKGKWRIAAQLKRPLRRHIFSVSYDEFTADNQLNRIFRYVVEKLWHLTHDNDNKQLLGELRQWLDEVTLLPHVTVADATPKQLTRLNEHYRPLLNLAQLFLDGGSLQMAADDFSTFSFVFDMNELFESFVATFIRRHAAAILPPELQACDYLVQSRGENRHLAIRETKNVFRTKPDIVFRRDQQFPLIVDMKYKRLNAADLRLGVDQSDFYQMHAYAHRYGCDDVLLIYPQTAETSKPLHEVFKLADCNKVIRAATVNLQIDLTRKHGRDALASELKALFTKGTS